MKYEKFWERWHPTYHYGTGQDEWEDLKLEMFEDLTSVCMEYLDDFNDYRRKKYGFTTRISNDDERIRIKYERFNY